MKIRVSISWHLISIHSSHYFVWKNLTLQEKGESQGPPLCCLYNVALGISHIKIGKLSCILKGLKV